MRNSRKSLPEVMKNIFRQQYAGVLHSRKARSAMRGRLSDDTRQHVWHYRKACFTHTNKLLAITFYLKWLIINALC